MTWSQIYKAEAVKNFHVLQNYMIFITITKKFTMLWNLYCHKKSLRIQVQK